MAVIRKILFVTTFYPRKNLLQYCQFVHEEAKAIMRKGYHVTVIHPCNDIKKIERWSLEQIPVISLPYHTWRTNYSYIINGVFLFHALKSLGKDFFNQFDFIHVHNCFPEGYAVYLLKNKFGLRTPCTVQIHDLNVYKDAYVCTTFIKKIFRHYSQIVYNAADYCIGVSPLISESICQCLPASSRHKVFTAYNGYNPDIFYPSQVAEGNHDALSDSPVRIIFVGNLIELKGVRNLVNAYCQLYHEFQFPTELWILGRGTLQKDLQAIVSKHHLEDHVSFKGYVMPNQVAEYLRQSHIFAMPSIYEGLGCVYLEAMACHLPCIACTRQGISELIKKNNLGILVPPNDIDKLKESLLKLVNLPEKRSFYQNNICAIISRFTWDEAVKPIVQIYKNSMSALIEQRNN